MSEIPLQDLSIEQVQQVRSVANIEQQEEQKLPDPPSRPVSTSSQPNTPVSSILTGGSDVFSSSVSTSNSELDNDHDDDKNLMKIEGKGITRFFERIPLPIKLTQLSLVAAIGMLILAIWVIVIRSSALTEAQYLNFVFNKQNKLYNGLDLMYEARTAAVMFQATKSSYWNQTKTNLRQGTNTGITSIITDPDFSANAKGKAAIEELKLAMAELSVRRGELDALGQIPYLTEADYSAIQRLDVTTLRIINAVTAAGAAMTMSANSRTVYTLSLIQKMRSAVEYTHNHMVMLITMGRHFGKHISESVNLAVQMTALFDAAQTYLNNEMNPVVSKDYHTLIHDTIEYKQVYNMSNSLMKSLVQTLQFPNISLEAWTNSSEALTANMKKFENKWQQEYISQAYYNYATAIVFIVVILAFILCCFFTVCINSLVMAKTITGPWQKMNVMLEQSISKFVPKDFLQLIHCNNVTDVKLGKAGKADLTVLSLDFKYSIVHSTAATSYRASTVVEQDEESVDDPNKKKKQTKQKKHVRQGGNQQLSANHQIHVLNEIFSFIGPIIKLHGGYIEKYLSNGCHAVFNHSRNAVFTALDLENSLESFNEKKKDSIQVMSIVIGIHSEKSAVIGTIGESERMESAIVSSAVKVAQSIKNLAKKLKSKVLISRDCLGFVKKSTSLKVQYRFLGTQSIVTESNTFPLRVYEVFTDTDPRVKYAKEFSKAVRLMEEGAVEDALKFFKIVVANNQMDAAASQLLSLCTILYDEISHSESNIVISDALPAQNVREAFKKHLVQEYNHEALLLWEQVVEALQLEATNAQIAKAQQVFNEFLNVNAKYDFQGLSQHVLQQFKDAVAENSKVGWSTSVLYAIKAECENLMLESFKRFKTSPIVRQALASVPRRNS